MIYIHLSPTCESPNKYCHSLATNAPNSEYTGGGRGLMHVPAQQPAIL